MKNNLKILRIIQTLDPKWGGPAHAIIDSSIMLQKKGFDVDILTYDKKNKINIKDKKIKIFNKGPGMGNYNFSWNLFFWLFKNKNKYDIYIIHGIWQFSTLLARILLKDKYYVFLHGGLDPYFQSEFIKSIKKKIYWYFFEKTNLKYSRSVILTNEFEKKQLSKTFVSTVGITKTNVGYGIIKPKFNKKNVKNLFYKKFPNLKNKNFLIFLGRFHKKKGCFVLFNAIKKILKKNKEIYFLMAGSESGYKKDLKNFSLSNGLERNIFWSNHIKGNLKWGAISCSKGMVLPSHGENFGLSLVESLSCSKPVLTTRKVGIHSKITDYKAGLVSNDTPEDFAIILQKFYKYNNKQLKILSKNSSNCFDKEFNISKKYFLAEYLRLNK